MLARAERELGLQSVAVAFDQNYLNYTSDEVLFRPDEHPLRMEAKRWRLLWRAARAFDIIHYNFGKTILPEYSPATKYVGARYPRPFYKAYDIYRRLQDMRDLSWLKRMGKGVVVTYQGDDARQGDFCQANFEISHANEVDADYYTPESDAHKRHRIERFARWADRIYALNPDLLYVLPPRAEFLPYATVDLREWSPPAAAAADGKSSERPTVLHAPTHRGAKGTRYVVEAAERLRAEGEVDFEFVLVEGLSHAEARRLYERADLLIDQLLCGWYGGLAVEFMALGKPVICYVREQDLKYIPPQMKHDLPIINAHPANIYDVLKEWLTASRNRLPALGRQSRAFVEKWHDPLGVAARLKRDYEDILMAKRRRQ